MTTSRLQLLAGAAGFALLVVACGSGVGVEGDATTPTTASAPATPSTPQEEAISDATTSSSAAPQAALGVLPDGPSALETYSAKEFRPPLIDPGEIISGGPPPDGIPPIDDPTFLAVGDHLDLLPDREPVVALEVDGDARAYPARVLIWHEIVNDTVGGVPVSVTYCPLCNSAATYVREINNVETTFGTSGRLFASALVMYDRATESLWTHFDGKAVVGLLAGEELESIPSPLMSWSDFRSAYPQGLVLDENGTGFSRDYGRNPYVGYDDVDSFPFLFSGAVDERAQAKQRIVGVTINDETVAYTLEYISGDATAPRATNIEIGDTPVVVFWNPGQASALQSSALSDGRDVGTVGVFAATVAGRVLTFHGTSEGFSDDQTSSTWNSGGLATSGTLAATQLERIRHLDTFWFAWATYSPDTVLIDG